MKNGTITVNGETHDRASLASLARDYGVPEHMVDGVAGYIVGDYKHMGHFLEALLAGDLFEALARADPENLRALPAYGRFLYNRAPRGCYGSRENVKKWLMRPAAKAAEHAGAPDGPEQD